MWKTVSSHLSKEKPSIGVSAWTVSALHEINYQVQLQYHLFEVNNPILAEACDYDKRALILIDQQVFLLYKNLIENYFHHYDITINFCYLSTGETNKEYPLLHKILDHIIEFQPQRRQEPIVVIGGGVLTDVVGLAAALYKRGIPFIRIPTTLMGMIDAAIGVKCGLNYAGKNKLGSYHPAQKTYIDPMFLWTLPETHIRNGIAEIIKMALIATSELFTLCQEHWDKFFFKEYNSYVDRIMVLAIDKMLENLSGNLFEYDLQRSVDFGHTWSPLIELSSEPMLHGYAVSIDMVYSTCIAKTLNLIDQPAFYDIVSLIARVGLPWKHSLMLDKIFVQEALLIAKIHRGGSLNLPLPNGIGQCVFVNELSEACLSTAHQLYKSLSMEEILYEA